ncbi:MAG: glycoside hydrolase family 127 protein [Clostridia bacterium]|nr:glycoside hydrolase family 127 protein [Clostridia bacterium]
MKYTSYGKSVSEKCSDKLERLGFGSAEFSGPVIEALDFVEKKSLLDPKLWSVFVDQFRAGDTDDHDLGWRGEYWGKMMRGACISYEYDQDKELYKVLDRTVRDLLTTADRYGRIATYSVPNEFRGWDVWCRKYVMLGFEYFLEICGDDELSDRILKAVKAQADYLIAKTGFNEVGKLNVTNTSEWWDGLNASSVLEPVVKLYAMCGDRKYLEYAEKIVACGGMRSFNLFKAALEGRTAPYEMPVTKAYEMMSNFEGILELYRVTGNEDYRTMALNFAELVQKTDITVIGSAGTTHELFDHSAVRQFDPAFTGIMQETCVTVTWMKFCLQLLRLTGDAVFADRIETSMYNALLGAVNFRGNPYEGEVFAFDSYSPLLNSVRGLAVGGYKDLCGGRMHWGCCVAIGSAGTGLFPGAAVMKSANGIAVNFYMQGRVRTERAELSFKTSYPYDGTVEIDVDPEAEGEFELMLRIPRWSAENTVTLNGEPIVCEMRLGYAVISRNWEKGDKVVLSLGVRTRIVYAQDIDPDTSANRFALVRGPVVLARDEAMGHDPERPIKIKNDNGFAVEKGGAIDGKVRFKTSVQTEDGYVEVCDYASCGQDWRNGKRMTAWLALKK